MHNSWNIYPGYRRFPSHLQGQKGVSTGIRVLHQINWRKNSLEGLHTPQLNVVESIASAAWNEASS